jgi:hypothetical protein
MTDKKKSILQVLAATAQERISKNRFQYSAVMIKIDPDSPLKGIEFEEHIQVSIYDSKADRDIVFSVKIENVTVIENALSGLPPNATA